MLDEDGDDLVDGIRAVGHGHALLAPEVTRRRMYLETMEKVLGDVNKVLLDGNAGGAGGVVPYLPLDQLRTAPQPGAAAALVFAAVPAAAPAAASAASWCARSATTSSSARTRSRASC